MMPSDPTIEGYYHSALEACAQASQYETEDRPDQALLEYRRSIALIETMRQMSLSPSRDTDEAYFAGVDDVEGICRVHIAKLEGELPASFKLSRRGYARRKSTEDLNTMERIGLTRAGSVPPRTERSSLDRSSLDRSSLDRLPRGPREPPKPSRTPSPEKKEKERRFMPLSLRPTGPVLARVSSSENSTTSSNAAVEASRAATLAWQTKITNGSGDRRKPRNLSPSASRTGTAEAKYNPQKRPSMGDTASLLDSPLIDFSAPVLSASAPYNQEYSLQTDIFFSPEPATSSTSHHPQTDTLTPRRKPPAPPKGQLGRSNAIIASRPSLKPSSESNPHPRSASAPDLSDTFEEPAAEVPPISVSVSGNLTREQELSREEKALKQLKGVDEALAKTILNDIVVRGDEVQWDDIAGLEEAKTALKETVIYPFLRPDLFSGLREPARGMLLFGPPGTGKTMLARAVATQAKSTFFSVSASTLVSKYLGESEKLVKALFALAKALSPSIIFVDEIDSLLSSRSGGDNENEASRRLKTEFLIQWSSLASAAAAREDSASPRVLVLAATNLPWAIDDAARRRFVLRQYIPLPEPETRRIQFKSLLSKQHHTLSDEQLEQLVELSEGFSGSDITALTKDAAMGPLRSLGEALLTTKREEIRPIGFEDFLTSLRKIRPSVSKEGLRAFERWNDEFGSKG